MGLAVLLAVVVYLPSLRNAHALDDVGDIVENTAVHGLSNTAQILTSPYRGQVPPGRSPYRPITSLSYALSWTMADGAPFPFHAFNVALHAVNTALVTGLLTVLGAAPLLALVGGALFAVHPVHSEAIANGVGRGDALMTLFILLGVLAYLRPWRAEWMRVALVAAAYALALGSKENGVVLPALLIAVTFLSPDPAAGASSASDSAVGASPAPDAGSVGSTVSPPHRPLLSQWPLFLALATVLAAYLAARHQVLGTLIHRDAAPYIIILPASLRMTTAVANVTELARLLLVPNDLAADYGPEVIVPAAISSMRFWGGLAVAVGLVALGALSLRRGKWIALGVAWTVLAIAVVGNLVFPVGVWVAERTLYLPSVGVSFLVVGAWHRLGLGAPGAPEAPEAPKHVQSTFLAGAAVLVLLGGARTWTRNAAWASTESVFLTLAEEHPESYRAQWWMGQTLVDAGEFDRGLEWLRQAGDLNPNELRVQLDYVRGLLLAGRAEQALSVVSDLPPFDPARDVYLTQSHIQLDQLEEAQAAVRAGLSRFPADSRLRNQAQELGVEPGGDP